MALVLRITSVATLGLFTAETAEGAEMNGVNELTNEIIGAAIEEHRHFTMGIGRLVRELPE